MQGRRHDQRNRGGPTLRSGREKPPNATGVTLFEGFALAQGPYDPHCLPMRDQAVPAWIGTICQAVRDGINLAAGQQLPNTRFGHTRGLGDLARRVDVGK